MEGLCATYALHIILTLQGEGLEKANYFEQDVVANSVGQATHTNVKPTPNELTETARSGQHQVPGTYSSH